MHCGALQCILGGFPKKEAHECFLITFYIDSITGTKIWSWAPPKKLATRISIFWICAVKRTIDCAPEQYGRSIYVFKNTSIMLYCTYSLNGFTFSLKIMLHTLLKWYLTHSWNSIAHPCAHNYKMVLHALPKWCCMQSKIDVARTMKMILHALLKICCTHS